MKNATSNKIRLGIFVAIGIVLFVGIVFFIGQRQQLFSSTFKMSGIFKDVSGLRVGNNVRFAGITVGTVNQIEIISDTTVRVDLVIEKKTQKFIKMDSRMIIGSDGLMGSKLVNISPGESTETVRNNGFVKSDVPASFDNIMANLETVSDNATVITEDLAAIVNSVKDGNGTVGKLFMDPTIANNLNKTLENAKSGIGGFSDNMEALKHNFLLKGYYKKKIAAEKEKTERDERIKNGTASKKDLRKAEEEKKAEDDNVDAAKNNKKKK